MPQPVTFRPRGGLILAVIAIVICALGLIGLILSEGTEGLFGWFWPIAAFAWGAWLLYINPCVTVTEGFVEIRNILRTHRVPWGDVDDVESRYALTVMTRDGRRIRAWAAPAPSARQALATRRDEVSRTPGEGDTRRPSDAEGTESGDATAIVRRHLETYRTTGGPGLPGGTTSTWNLWLVAVTVAVVAAALATLAGAAAHG
ncbi:PH domain-containing protein [Microbacterium terricola]|uniref:Low molecular weight protein antigen 6 PH domain-containing protein n=1 Tax=Microbacterium terricola TaxID=344163 RepID=A0ABM8DZS7_9MICO|nr:PH domain-containing protein [Microbacterium terricola]UYK41204.1 PH domain-containing protein [Microbacterium terricola]BDV31021.1 hypothetical protein Microterr_16810 [Microbacterium terricola]